MVEVGSYYRTKEYTGPSVIKIVRIEDNKIWHTVGNRTEEYFFTFNQWDITYRGNIPMSKQEVVKWKLKSK
jgi:hypothetical protein